MHVTNLRHKLRPRLRAGFCLAGFLLPFGGFDSNRRIDPRVACFALTPGYFMSGFQPEDRSLSNARWRIRSSLRDEVINGASVPALKGRPKVMPPLRGANFCRPLRGL